MVFPSTHLQKQALSCFVLVVFLNVVGCHKQQLSQQYSFLVLPRTQGNAFHSSLVAGAKAEAKEQRISLQVNASAREDDYDFQEQELLKLLHQRSFDGVIITPGHSTKLIPTLRRLDQQRVPFIVVDTPLELSGEKAFAHYCGFIGTDNRRGGNLAAEYVGEKIRKGNVLLVRGVMTHRTSQDRELGFLEVIKRYPDVRIVHVVEGEWNSEDAKKALHPFARRELSKIDAVFAYNDLMALGAAEVMRRSNLHPLIVGYDGILEVQSAIIAGQIDATVTQAPETMGKRAVVKLRQCIEEQSFPASTELTHVTLLMATRTLTAVSSYEQK